MWEVGFDSEINPVPPVYDNEYVMSLTPIMKMHQIPNPIKISPEHCNLIEIVT